MWIIGRLRLRQRLLRKPGTSLFSTGARLRGTWKRLGGPVFVLPLCWCGVRLAEINALAALHRLRLRIDRIKTPPKIPTTLCACTVGRGRHWQMRIKARVFGCVSVEAPSEERQLGAEWETRLARRRGLGDLKTSLAAPSFDRFVAAS